MNPTKLDIVREMRDSADRVEEDYHDEDVWTNTEAAWIYRDLADRLEAARKRDAPQGNAAAMREALECVQEAFDSNDFGAMGDCPSDRSLAMAEAVRRKVEVALAAPARNCDVGTAEEQEARYFKLKTECNDRLMRCPHMGTSINFPPDSLEWAQMPYEEGDRK